MAKILITGGTGLVGTHLSKLLTNNGHEVVHLSRSSHSDAPYKTYLWNVKAQAIDEEAFDGVHYIIHLAGAGLADEPWTDARKQIILDSRVDSIKLLHHYVEKLDLQLHAFISASAIGYYGLDTGATPLDETTPAGNDFLADVVKKWEAEADTFKPRTKVAKVRIGVILSEKGGALVQMARPVKLWAGAPLGNGKQYMSWIHIDDLCGIFAYIMKNNLEGIYNAAAPNPVTNEELTKSMAKTLKKPLILPKVPAFAMKIILGEMAQMVLGGNFVLSDKIREEGFEFKYTFVDQAVKSLLG